MRPGIPFQQAAGRLRPTPFRELAFDHRGFGKPEPLGLLPEAGGAPPCRIERPRASDVADAFMSELDEVLDRGGARARVVHDDAAPAPTYRAVGEDVRGRQLLDRPEKGMSGTRRRHDQAVDPPGADEPGEHVVRLPGDEVLGEQDDEVPFERPPKRAADDPRVHGHREVRDHEPDRARLRAPEAAGRRVRPIVEPPRRLEHALPRVRADRDVGRVVQDARRRRLRDTGRARDVEQPRPRRLLSVRLHSSSVAGPTRSGAGGYG